MCGGFYCGKKENRIVDVGGTDCVRLDSGGKRLGARFQQPGGDRDEEVDGGSGRRTWRDFGQTEKIRLIAGLKFGVDRAEAEKIYDACLETW